MPRQILVDTVFVIALINERDQYHQQALDLAELVDALPLIVTDVVLIEIGNALARSHKREAVNVLEQFLTADEVEVVRLTPSLFEQAFSLYKTYQDKQWSLVDCVSFIVMRERGISEALTADQHFVQAGFQALLQGV